MAFTPVLFLRNGRYAIGRTAANAAALAKAGWTPQDATLEGNEDALDDVFRDLVTNPASEVRAALRAALVPVQTLVLNPDMLISGTITRDANGAATAAPVTWPDGTAGQYTATTVSTAFPGAVDAYTITYGSPATKTYTQPAVTRDTNGAVTQRPALQVA